MFSLRSERVNSAGRNLRVIDPFDKFSDSENITLARTQIAYAGRVYVLGYGFDEHNSERLGLRESLADSVSSHKIVSFTNFQDINKVNKRASAIFFGQRDRFPSGGPTLIGRYEKSCRNVYDALNLDFDIE
jgi:hypothetical protein